jgi:hypothetical protein
MERKIYRVFYTADRANGSRLEEQMVVEAVDIPAAKRIAMHYLNLWGVINPRNLQAIDMT